MKQATYLSIQTRNSLTGEPVEQDIPKALSLLPQFAEIGATQAKSVGCVPPRGEGHELLVEEVGDWSVICVRIDTKSVPPKTVEKLVDAMAKDIEESVGRKPGKKVRRELKERALLELLPAAFPRTKVATVYLHKDGHILIDSASGAVVDEVTTTLGLATELHPESHSAGRKMTAWVHDREVPHQELELGRAVTLVRTDDGEKVSIAYTGLATDADDIVHRIETGMTVRRLQLSLVGRLDFVATDTLQLRSIEFDTVRDVPNDEAQGAFEADALIHANTVLEAFKALHDTLAIKETAE